MDDGVKVGSPANADTQSPAARHSEAPAEGPLTFASSIVNGNGSGGADGVSSANNDEEPDEGTRVSAYARLDFESFTFYVQTLQVVLGRRAQNGQNMVDVHLGAAKAISRRHAKIFYNFATHRFELTVMGRNGAFVGDNFVENGMSVPLKNNTRIQIGQITFKFVLPSQPKEEEELRHDPDATELHPTEQLDASTDSNEDETNFFAVQEKKKPKSSALGGSSSANASASPPPPPKPKRREYLPEEIPMEHREKPQLSYSVLISRALQERAPEQGLSLSDIYEAIMELFPYYRYCPSGWQNSVRHNLSSSKAFRKVSKEGKGYLWGLDQSYIAEKEQKRAAAKQRRSSHGSNDKSIAELAQEIPARRPSESNRPRTESGNLLSPALIRLLARLQSQLQGHLAKAGGKSINQNILSNALANVVARAAKASGGIDQLEKLLQSPQQVNLILVQALEFVKYRGASGSGGSGNSAPAQNLPEPANLPVSVTSNLPAHVKVEGGSLVPTDAAEPTPEAYSKEVKPELIPQPAAAQDAQTAQIPSIAASSLAAPVLKDEPRTETSRGGAQEPIEQPSVAQPQTNPETALVPQPTAATAPPPQPVNVSIQGPPAQPQPKASPPPHVSAPAPAQPQHQTHVASAAPAKPKYTPEQIAQLIAQAEKVQNPSPSILAAIEQLRAHQRAMLKRPAEGAAVPEQQAKHARATINEA